MADSDAEISGGEDCLNDDNPTEDLEVEDANSYELNLGPGFTPRKDSSSSYSLANDDISENSTTHPDSLSINIRSNSSEVEQEEDSLEKFENKTQEPATSNHEKQEENRSVKSLKVENETIEANEEKLHLEKIEQNVNKKWPFSASETQSSSLSDDTVPIANKKNSIAQRYLASLNPANECLSNPELQWVPRQDVSRAYIESISKSPPTKSSPPWGVPSKDQNKKLKEMFEQNGQRKVSHFGNVSPKKLMLTSVDKDSIKKTYEDVRSDTSDTDWAVFKFEEDNTLKVTATGSDFDEFKSCFGSNDRGFGYIRIKTGDERSKRAKFVFLTWVGQSLSVIKKAKMSTDKALIKNIIQNFSVELQLESPSEISLSNFKIQVDRAAGACYGTGTRDP